jgi:hypothetical protein
LLLLTILLWVGAASAQLNIPVIRGDNGLKSGSQPGPGTYFTGVYYFYDADEVVDANGTRFNRVSIEQSMPMAAITYVSKKKLLGANYSATVVLPLLNAAIDRPQALNVSGLGYSDTYVQPLQLGWHKKRHDVLIGYGLFMPRDTLWRADQTTTDWECGRMSCQPARRFISTRRSNGMPRPTFITTFSHTSEARTGKRVMFCRSKVGSVARSVRVCAMWALIITRSGK